MTRFRQLAGGNGRGTSQAVDAYRYARERMVETQLVPRGIHDPQVVHAMRTVPRHLFVPPHLRQHAYEDRPLDIGKGQTISQPFMVAAMTQMLGLQPHHHVLEIGTGSGYQAAVLAVLAAHVTTVERIPELAEQASRVLAECGYTNARVFVGDGTLGWPENAPYDAILVTAGGPAIPDALKMQLADRGVLVCPVGSREMQRLSRVVRTGDSFREEESIGCVFVPLIGEDGWPD
ncbi:MAG: protein-L-isoaspartate O-methyltransferase [Candidatus Hydrogenedentota bacterium]